jgi:RNA polymerase sigma factor (sigma-70 family)
MGLHNHCRGRLVTRLRTRSQANESEDIVQDALVQAIQRIDQFSWQGREVLQGWWWAFVENAHAGRRKYHARHCRDERRVVQDVSPSGADTSQAGVLAGMAGREETPSRQAWRRERDARLRLAMRDALTDDQRLVIELRYFEFLPVKEVARHSGCPRNRPTRQSQRGTGRRNLHAVPPRSYHTVSVPHAG